MAQGWKSGLVRLFEWISRLAYINLLWIGFTLLGLIVFGFMPATVAMFGVLRKLMKGNLNSSIFKEYWSFYRKEFKKSNVVGIILLITSYIMYVDVFVFEFGMTKPMQILQFCLFILAFLYLMVIVFIFPVYVQFELKWYKYFTMSFLVAVAAPFRSILMLILGYGVFFLMVKMPVIMFFFLGSVISSLWLMVTLPIFYKLEQRED